MILSICSNPEVLEVMRIINVIILFIQIAVPILLILTGMTTLMSTIKVGNDDLLAKAKKQLVNNSIAAVVIFLIPTLVNVIVKISDSNNEYRDCLYADTEIISNAYVSRANELLSSAEKSKTYNDYYAAKDAVSKIKDENEKASLEDRLENLYKNIKDNIDKNNSENNENGNSSSNANTGNNLNVSAGSFEYTGVGNITKYTLFTPTNAKENMPLIVMLPASNGDYSAAVNEFKNMKHENDLAFMMVVYPSGNYSTQAYSDIKSTADEVVSKYKINKSKIGASGFSSSGTYVYHLVVNNQGYFHSMVPISSGVSAGDKVLKGNLDYLKTLNVKGYGENGGAYDANGKKCAGWTNWSPSSSMTSAFNALGKSNNFVNLGKICHSNVRSYVFNLDENNNNRSDYIEWFTK